MQERDQATDIFLKRMIIIFLPNLQIIAIDDPVFEEHT